MAEPGANATDEDRVTKLLLSDLTSFQEALWRNEESGERRLNFLITLITAALAGLAALHTSVAIPAMEESPQAAADALESLAAIRNGALGALVALGLVTYFRMLKRNQVTDEFIMTLKLIRQKLSESSAPDYSVPLEAADRWHRFFRGGLADTAAVITASLTCALSISLKQPEEESIIGSLLLLFLLLLGASNRKRELSNQKVKPKS